jgi:hypothetical protein
MGCIMNAANLIVGIVGCVMPMLGGEGMSMIGDLLKRGMSMIGGLAGGN